ncbi:MAG: type II toxin-antitoxin system HicA family toxin [Dehalococcoidia bacterium]
MPASRPSWRSPRRWASRLPSSRRQPRRNGKPPVVVKRSRVRIALNGVRAVFHRPHPQNETDKGALKSVRRFLSEAGIEP